MNMPTGYKVDSDAGTGYGKKKVKPPTPGGQGWRAAWTAQNNPDMNKAVVDSNAANAANGQAPSISGALAVHADRANTGPTLRTPSTNPSSGGGQANAMASLQAFANLLRTPQDFSGTFGQIDSATNQLAAQMRGMPNPYAAGVMPQPQVAADPMAAYMQAGGVDNSGVAALQQMLQASAQTTQQADQVWAQRMQQAAAAQNQGFAQQAILNGGAAKQGILSQAQSDKQNLVMQLLSMGLQNGIDVSALLKGLW